MFRSAENIISVFTIRRKRNCYPWPSAILLPPFIPSPSALISFIKYFTLQKCALIMFVDNSDCLTGHAPPPTNKFSEVYLQGL